MAFVQLREDIYGGGPQNSLLRYWLSLPITREIAEQSLHLPEPAPPGSFIVRRSISSPGNYAITCVLANGKVRSYEVHDLGLGQVGLSTGQAFASLEHMIEYFYDQPFPDPGNNHVPLTRMHPYLHGFQPMQAGPPGGGAPAPDATYGEIVGDVDPSMGMYGSGPNQVPVVMDELHYGDEGQPIITGDVVNVDGNVYGVVE